MLQTALLQSITLSLQSLHRNVVSAGRVGRASRAAKQFMVLQISTSRYYTPHRRNRNMKEGNTNDVPSCCWQVKIEISRTGPGGRPAPLHQTRRAGGQVELQMTVCCWTHRERMFMVQCNNDLRRSGLASSLWATTGNSHQQT